MLISSFWSNVYKLMMFQQSCPILAVLFYLSFFLVVLSCLGFPILVSSPGSTVLAVCPGCPVPNSPVLVVFSWQACHCYLLIAVSSFTSVPGRPDYLF
jgi:hypothetical protein